MGTAAGRGSAAPFRDDGEVKGCPPVDTMRRWPANTVLERCGQLRDGGER